MSGERTNVPSDRRIMFDEDDDFDLRLALAAKRNKETQDCNGRPDCRAARHLTICKASSKG